MPNRRAVLVLSGAQQPAAQPVAQGLASPVTMREGHD
jgi:hypothetical protein